MQSKFLALGFSPTVQQGRRCRERHGRHISEGQINKVRDALPKSLRQMWVTAEDPTIIAEESLILTE